MDQEKMKAVENLIRDKSEVQLKDLNVELCKRVSDAYEYIPLWGKAAGGVDVTEKRALICCISSELKHTFYS